MIHYLSNRHQTILHAVANGQVYRDDQYEYRRAMGIIRYPRRDRNCSQSLYLLQDRELVELGYDGSVTITPLGKTHDEYYQKLALGIIPTAVEEAEQQ